MIVLISIYPNWRQRRESAPPTNLPPPTQSPNSTLYNIKYNTFFLYENARTFSQLSSNIGSINFIHHVARKTLIFQSANRQTHTLANDRHDSPDGGAKRECVPPRPHKPSSIHPSIHPFNQPTIQTLFNMFDYRRELCAHEARPSFSSSSIAVVRRAGIFAWV